VLCETGSDGREHREDGSDEDGAAATEEFIDWVRDPCSAIKKKVRLTPLIFWIGNSQQGNGNIRTGVHKTNNPPILGAGAGGRTSISRIRDTELDREAQIRAIGAGLIPALDGGSN